MLLDDDSDDLIISDDEDLNISDEEEKENIFTQETSDDNEIYLSESYEEKEETQDSSDLSEEEDIKILYKKVNFQTPIVFINI